MRRVLLIAFVVLVLALAAEALTVEPSKGPAGIAVMDPTAQAHQDSAFRKKFYKSIRKTLPQNLAKRPDVKALLRDRIAEAQAEKAAAENWVQWGKDHNEAIEQRKEASKPDPNKPQCKDCHYLPPEPVSNIKIEDIPVPFTKGAIMYVDGPLSPK